MPSSTGVVAETSSCPVTLQHADCLCAMLTLTSTAKRSDYYKLFTSARFGTMLQCASQSLRAFHQLSNDTY
jgi:hypothetical protein